MAIPNSDECRWHKHLQFEVTSSRHQKGPNSRNIFFQVAAEHPSAFLKGMSWNPATVDQLVPTGSQDLIIGDSLIRDLTETLVVDQTIAISFGGASTLILMIGQMMFRETQSAPKLKWEPLLVCLLNELKKQYRQRLMVMNIIRLNPDAGLPIAHFMNGNVTRSNTMVWSLIVERSD